MAVHFICVDPGINISVTIRCVGDKESVRERDTYHGECIYGITHIIT